MNRYTWRTGVLEAVMILTAIVFMFPIYILVNMSLRGKGDLTPYHLPTANPTFDNFVNAWQQSEIGRALVNSIVITTVSVLIIVFLGAMAAYGLVRATAAWSKVTFYIFLFGLLIPFQLTMVPMYQTFAKLDMIGSPVTLVMIYIGMRMPFTVFLYAAFLRALPLDYEEAASIDGAGPFRRFWQVAFPLMKPVTATVIILTSLYIWNDFLAPLLYIGGTPFRTVPLEVYGGRNNFAGHLISMLPVLIAFFILQKSLMKSFASGIKL